MKLNFASFPFSPEINTITKYYVHCTTSCDLRNNVVRINIMNVDCSKCAYKSIVILHKHILVSRYCKSLHAASEKKMQWSRWIEVDRHYHKIYLLKKKNILLIKRDKNLFENLKFIFNQVIFSNFYLKKNVGMYVLMKKIKFLYIYMWKLIIIFMY